uniref:CHHC U11-48K-type domain-containing protein n=1 Tax=Lutzomyia longipalpis TaxID=7200 RepID=A0A1B0GLH3_LUTLO
MEQSEMTQGTKGTKLVDTRTFTRPKKRGMLENDYEGAHHSGVNLQVGGLVTSMRRSLIGETSPPSSFCSSVDSMNEEMLNSLINSGDFNNVSFFMENMEDSTNINFNGYSLEDAIKDRHFLETLTSCEDQSLSKDASISRTDDHVVSAESSDSNPLIDVTMRLNPNFEGTFVTKDTTFNISNEICGPTPTGNETYNLMGNTTIEISPVRSHEKDVVQTTFKCDTPKRNTTFGILPEKETSIGATFLGENHINQTYIELKNGSEPLKTDQPEKVDKKTPDSSEWCYQSTPLKFSKKETHRRINLSPIKCDQSVMNVSKEGNFEKFLQEATNQAFTPDKMIEKPRFDTSPDDEVVELRRLPIPINLLREDERQSLKNFEEYEKTLMQDVDSNDREFDDVLNRFATLDIQQSNEKMRQSLDSIKKRHSLVNLEKQQQEEVAKLEDGRFVDSNKLSESMGKSRRLLSRRSRIYDDVSNSLNHTQDTESVPEEQKQPDVGAESERTPTKGNRDRFKTIRIIRPLDQNSPRLPDAGDTTVVIEPPEPAVEPEEQPRHVELERNQTFKKPAPTRNLPRPRYFKSALAKPISQQKFNSADDLLDSEEPQMRNISQQPLKSPMGTKSKSIHNLLSGQRSLASMEKLNHPYQCDFKSSAEALHKTQSNSKLSLAPSSKFGKSNQSLARPSSRAPDVERPWKMDEELVLCPYNRTHLISPLRMPQHLLKCKRSHPDVHLVACDYNALHLVKPEALNAHYETCIDFKRKIKKDGNDQFLENTFMGNNPPSSIGTATIRNNTKKLGLIRPSSGYYSYSVRRNDSDTESGRYSPQSLSSSASSNVSEVPQNQDATFDSHQTYNSLQPDIAKRPGSVISKVPRPTGLRLPSNFRSGGTSALPRSTGIPRR